MAAKRRLKNAKITHISLCKRGKNKLRTVMKADGALEFQTVSKMGKEGLLYSLVWVPEMTDVDGDIMNAAEVQKMCHGWLSNGGSVDIEHDQKALPTDKVQICENLIVQKGDQRFADMTYEGERIDPTGAWGTVFKILDPELKADFESGELDGVSMFGQAEVEPVYKHQLPTRENVMDEEEIIKAIEQAMAKSLPAALKAIAKAEAQAKKEAKKEADLKKAQDAPEKIKFEGDPTSADDIAKHQNKVAFANLDFNDPKQVEAYRESLAKSDASDEGESKEVTEIKAAQVKLAKQLEQIEKASTVGGQADKIVTKSDADESAAELCGLSKSEMEGAQLGADLMQAAFGKPKATEK